MAAASAFVQRLVKSGAVKAATVSKAIKRQQLYGGGLDTALLEMGEVDEATLWEALVAETGMAPVPPAMLAPPIVEPRVLFDHATARALGAVAFHAQLGADHDEDEHRGAIEIEVITQPACNMEVLKTHLGARRFECFIAPEARFEGLLGSLYRRPVPTRFLTLLGRLVGAANVRKDARRRAPSRANIAAPLVETGPLSPAVIASRREAEKRARREAERRQREAEEKVRHEAERLLREAEEDARLADQQAQLEAARQRREAETQARLAAEKARADAERTRQEEERRRQILDAANQQKIEREQQRIARDREQIEQERRRMEEAAKLARLQAEHQRARDEAERAARDEAEQKRRAAEAQARKEASEARKEAQQAREDAERTRQEAARARKELEAVRGELSRRQSEPRTVPVAPAVSAPTAIPTRDVESESGPLPELDRLAPTLLELATLYLDVAGGPRGVAAGETILAAHQATDLFAIMPTLFATAPDDDERPEQWLDLIAQAPGALSSCSNGLTSPDRQVRLWAAEGLSRIRLAGAGDEALALVLVKCFHDEDDRHVRRALLRALRGRLRTRAGAGLAQDLRKALAQGSADAARRATIALLELRDEGAIEISIERLPEKDCRDFLHDALMVLTGQDFGVDRGRWRRWWKSAAGTARVDWLLDGLASRKAAVRFVAANELRAMTGQYFGYHFDLPARERKTAVARWHAWREKNPGI